MTTRARRRKKTSHAARPEPLTRREPPAERDPPTRSRYLPLLVVVAAAAAYANSLTVPFVFDDVSIPETPELHRLWPPSALIGTTRPLVQLSLALNYAAGGLVVIGYHLVNLAIHVAAALALFGLVALTLRTARLRTPWAGDASQLALAASGLWAVHPLQTESVTYVVQRSESLMALCYLLTLYCVARSAAAERPRPWQLAAVVACPLGMLSKPGMVTAPIPVLLYDRVFLAGSWSRAWRERRALYLGLAATWGILLGLLTAPHESGTTAGFTMRDLTWLEYTSSQPAVVLHYLRLAIWPQGLVLDYAWPVAHGFAVIAPPLLVLIGLMVATVVLFRREPSAGFLGAAFFLILAPSSSVVPIKDLAFEHRMYLPLAPLAVLAVVSAQILIERVVPGAQRQRRVETGLALAAVIALTITTAARNSY